MLFPLANVHSVLRVGALFVSFVATPVWAAKHREIRLEVDTMVVTRGDQKKKAEISTEGTDGSTDTKEDEESWGFFSALPIISLSVYHDGMVIGTRIFGLLGIIGGDVYLGKETDPTTEFGGYISSTYTGEVTETKAGDADKQKSHDADRSLSIGPYGRFTVIMKPAKMELLTLLTINRSRNDDATTAEKRDGYTIQLGAKYLTPIRKNVHYFADFRLALVNEDGETKSGTTTQKLKDSSSTNFLITLLGLRMKI